MISKTLRAALLVALAVPVALSAQATAPAIKQNMMVSSSDGQRIGRIYDVEKTDGAVSSVSIIRNSRLIRLSASTLTSGEKGLTTSLSSAEVAKLK